MRNTVIVSVLMLALVAVAATAGIHSLYAETPEEQLQSFLKEQDASEQAIRAYRFAVQHPEVLKAMPCYCGCVRSGHMHNLNCFVKKIDGDQFEFDRHGTYCTLCMQIAYEAEQELKKGKSLYEIRQHIDAPFKEKPHMKPTPTPMPEKP